MIQYFKNLLRDTRGLATVEFAFIASVFFAVLLPFMDFAIFALQKQEIEQAHSKASLFAYSTSDDINTRNIELYLRNNLDLPGNRPNITITCNGMRNCVDTSRPCACPTATRGRYAAQNCGDICPDGSRSGYYLTIDSEYQFESFLFEDSPLINENIVSTSTLRLP